MAGQFVPVKLNGEKNGAAAARLYGISGYPCILFLDASGREVAKINGYAPPERFAQYLKQIRDAARKRRLTR